MKTSALVAAARTGDLRAFATLVERYYPMARATCARSPGDEDLALDVTQEAVVTAMLSLDRLRHDDRSGAWLTGIALNLRAKRGPRCGPASATYGQKRPARGQNGEKRWQTKARPWFR
jgi:hypothetical protein